ncbi:hypothetical protein [Parasphingopyxis sp.]|uniref:hypothetical protein n=1 Tax=Parasphingopyxis sp. TaxID=1920299 RepID=UPI0026184DDB|nr:hypothetical protein [Parasphingopyxis sp.]
MKNRTPVICDRCRATGYLGEGKFAQLKPRLDFTPVPRKTQRHDGWTPERQRGFIEALARTGSVTRAAAAVNMAKEGAYQLRLHPEAAEFRDAWAAALDYGTHVLADAALDRAIHGVPIPIMHDGKQVAERRTFNERLTMWQLQHRMPETYGKPGGAGTKSPETNAREDWEARADDRLRALEIMLIHYRNRVQMEREHRRAGEIDEADFYARQLTHIEVLIEAGGGANDLMDIANGKRDSDRPWTLTDDDARKSTVLTDLLAQMRAEAWAADAAGEELIGQHGHEQELRAIARRGREGGDE